MRMGDMVQWRAAWDRESADAWRIRTGEEPPELSGAVRVGYLPKAAREHAVRLVRTPDYVSVPLVLSDAGRVVGEDGLPTDTFYRAPVVRAILAALADAAARQDAAVAAVLAAPLVDLMDRYLVWPSVDVAEYLPGGDRRIPWEDPRLAAKRAAAEAEARRLVAVRKREQDKAESDARARAAALVQECARLMAAWIEAHGSDRLREGARRGYDMLRLYREERTREEAGEGYRPDAGGLYTTDTCGSPTAEALAELDRLEALGASTEEGPTGDGLAVVWVQGIPCPKCGAECSLEHRESSECPKCGAPLPAQFEAVRVGIPYGSARYPDGRGWYAYRRIMRMR